ncbi:YcxB family protein [Flavobacterium sp.]|uniref:YcxB family protein n=1 Tax=Flavobacterium sp. TaxID=239 RepID=UPI00261E147B|nr:YcxB family protein [Flavobacterium sp.]
MESFSIVSNMSKNQYLKVMLLGLYSKPAFIAVVLFGGYLVIFNESYQQVVLGLAFVLSPVIIALIAARQFGSSPGSGDDIAFTFGENGITVEGSTCRSEFTWEHIVKQKEISNFLILYHSKRVGNFVDKRKLSAAQLQFIKDCVGKKKETL